jgi:hypothetical protein
MRADKGAAFPQKGGAMTRTTNVTLQELQKATAAARRPYAKPELIKHGTVETTTQLLPPGTSGPTY